jgi:hypothetical protein
MRGGMEAIYGDVAPNIGFMSFAPIVPARGSMFTAAHRSSRGEDLDAVVSEQDLYGK